MIRGGNTVIRIVKDYD